MLRSISAILFWCCCSFTFLCAQSDRLWFFGERAGLEFTSSDVMAHTDNALGNTYYGSFTLNDDDGNLLLYTNGQRVYNRFHRAIPGLDLLPPGGSGGGYFTFLVPQPGSSLVYIFSAIQATLGNTIITYSTIDLEGNGGEGSTLVQDQFWLSRAMTSLAIVRHCNNRDFWVIAHGLADNHFYSYLLDDQGLASEPVETTIGEVAAGTFDYLNIGATLQASYSGKRISLINDGNEIQVFDFDRETGIVLRAAYNNSIGGRYKSYRSAAFSPSESLLYVTALYDDIFPDSQVFRTHLLQIDLNQPPGSSAYVQLAERLYTVTPYIPDGTILKTIGDLQFGPDGRIYVCQNLLPSLSRINKPDLVGTACDFATNVVDLQGRKTGIYLSKYLPPKRPEPEVALEISANSGSCNRTLQAIQLNDRFQEALDYYWFRNDSLIASGTSDSLVIFKSGNYSVQVVEREGCLEATANSLNIQIETELSIPPVPSHITICTGAEPPLIDSGLENTFWYRDPQGKILLDSGRYFRPLLETRIPDRYYFYALQKTPDACAGPVAKVEIEILASPDLSRLPAVMPYCFAEEAQLDLQAPQGADWRYEWFIGGQIMGTNVDLRVSEYGAYRLRVVGANLCRAEQTISIEENCRTLFIPNAFSPNGDGINDYLQVFGDKLDAVDIRIFDRWGNQVQYLKDIDLTSGEASVWDGRYRNRSMPGGVYIYQLTATRAEPALRFIHQQGSFTLIK